SKQTKLPLATAARAGAGPRASLRPMPPLPPVTAATRPLRSNSFDLLVGVFFTGIHSAIPYYVRMRISWHCSSQEAFFWISRVRDRRDQSCGEPGLSDDPKRRCQPEDKIPPRWHVRCGLSSADGRYCHGAQLTEVSQFGGI